MIGRRRWRIFLSRITGQQRSAFRNQCQGVLPNNKFRAMELHWSVKTKTRGPSFKQGVTNRLSSSTRGQRKGSRGMPRISSDFIFQFLPRARSLGGTFTRARSETGWPASGSKIAVEIPMDSKAVRSACGEASPSRLESVQDVPVEVVG